MKRISFIALVIILTACTFGRNSEVNTNQQKWNNASIQHYRFELSISCFCAFRDQMPITVEVQNGAIVSMTGKDGSLINTTDPNYANFSQYATIDSLFAELKTDLAKADQVTVTYDPIYGFPAAINIDFIKAAADDELYLSAAGFEKLP